MCCIVMALLQPRALALQPQTDPDNNHVKEIEEMENCTFVVGQCVLCVASANYYYVLFSQTQKANANIFILQYMK